MLSKSTKRAFCLRQMLQHPQAPHPANTPTFIKGSSVRYRKTTCKDCGETWQEEREGPTEEPESCTHRHTDHRGSNKFVRKNYCKDCGTYIDSVEQGLAKSLQAENPWVSKAEQVLLDSVSDHEHLTREQAIAAAKQMTIECEQLEPGDYKMLDIATMFVDCGDRASLRCS